MGQYGAEGLAEHGRDYRSVLAHYYPGTKLAEAPEDARVRVLLHASAAAVFIGSVNALRLVDADGKSATLPPGNYRLDSTLRFRAGDRFLAPHAPVRIIPSIAPLTLNRQAYHGTFVVRSDGAGLRVVNDVAIDDYVRGVIAWEMPASWHREALRAQAVAARSYALASLTPSRSFDVYPDQRSQMYGGLRAERAGSNQAVLTTLRQVLVWDGHVAATYFSSSSGGRTADVRDVWPGGRRVPYLVSVPDPYDSRSPQHHWGPYLLSASTLAARLGLDSVFSVQTVSDRSGRAAYLIVHGRRGVTRVSGSDAARALGLRSTWFTIRSSGTPRPTAKSAAARTASNPTAHAGVLAARARPIHVEASAPRATWPLMALGAALFAVLAIGSLRQRQSAQRSSPQLQVAAVGGIAFLAGCLAVTLRGGNAVHRSVSAVTQEPRAVTDTRPRPSNTPRPTLQVAAEPALPRISTGPAASGDTLEWHDEAQPVTPAAAPHLEGERPTPAAASGAPLWSRTPDQPVARPSPLEIGDVTVRSLTSSSVALDWSTNLPAISQGATGLGLSPLIWSTPEPAAVDHATTLTGLGESTAYRVWLFAQDDFNQTARKELLITTLPAGEQADVATTGDTITVNNEPLFPLMLWSICTNEVGSKLALGINVFMANGCGSGAELVEALAGRGLAVVDRAEKPTAAEGVIGSYFPDEWDASLPSSIKPADLLGGAAPAADRGVSFLTLTNHFYSRASALPQGKGMYPALYSIPDVIGFDLYPLQTWCRPAFADVFDAQAELQRASGGKPTFQWIEVAPMEHPCNAAQELNPTPATVRAEAWLAVAGGADGIGYFPNNWSSDVGNAIAQTNWQLRELAPALLAWDAQATTEASDLRVSARSLNGALYVIAINTSDDMLSADIDVPGLAGRTTEVLGESRTITADGDRIHDDFAPLAVHIFIAPPSPWTPPGAEPAQSEAADGPDPEPIAGMY
jgi:stage II sporulation protein D